MMFYRISRDDRGVAAVEMALVLPVLFLFIYGIFQIGALMAANAVMQSALGEGAREATIWPARTDTQIKTRIQSEVYNVYAGTFVVADPTTTSVTAVSGKAATGSSSAVTAVAGVKKNDPQNHLYGDARYAVLHHAAGHHNAHQDCVYAD